VTVVALGTSLTGGRWRWPDVAVEEWPQAEYPGQVRLVNLGVGASASTYVPGAMNPAVHEGKCGLDRDHRARVPLEIPARGYVWLMIKDVDT